MAKNVNIRHPGFAGSVVAAKVPEATRWIAYAFCKDTDSRILHISAIE